MPNPVKFQPNFFFWEIFIAPKDLSLNFTGSLLSYFWAIMLISVVMSIFEDFGSLLPARSVAVNWKIQFKTERSDVWMFSEECMILDLCSWNSWVRSLTGTNSHWSEPEHEEELFDENKNWNILVLEQWRKNAVNCIVLISRKSTNSRIDPLKW